MNDAVRKVMMSDLHRVEWFVSILFIPLPRRPHDLHPRFLQPQTSPRPRSQLWRYTMGWWVGPPAGLESFVAAVD